MAQFSPVRFLPFVILVALLLSLPLVSGFSLVETGSTLTLDGVYYYVPATPFAHINPISLRGYTSKELSENTLFPVTVVSGKHEGFGIQELEDTVSDFAKDDVWGKGFLESILLQYSPDISLNPKLLSTNPHTFSPNITTILTFLPPSRALFPPGPYFLSASGALYQPLRLYSDVSGAFTQSVTAGPSSTYVALPASIPGIEAVAVGVPSRLYYTKTAAKPLAGVRLGVKDIYDLRGQRTSDGNRAFYALYPPRTANANPVQRLIDAGAIVVGKMKTSQFANGELATADWVDYHAPFNPRADGYQDGSSSSTGAGSGEGSYSWLDLSLGSDTGGSIRGPAQVQGVFGNRPSHGAVELTNTMSLAPQLDTSGFLTRDTSLWLTASKVLYANITFSSALPKKLRALDFPTTAASTEDSILIKFLAQLESFLGVEASPYNLTTSWATTKPDPALPPLTEYLNKTYPTLIAVQQSRNVRNPFFADYAAKYDGRTPFVDPVPTRRWAYGDEVGQPALDRELARKKVFQNWWTGEVLGTKGEGECSDGILVYNVKAKTQYRNIYLDPPQPPFGFDNTEISIFSEVPDMVVPLGSQPYNSTITNHVELLPVTVNFMAAKGCDGVIFNLVNELRKAGIVKDPSSGRTITGGDILLRREEW